MIYFLKIKNKRNLKLLKAIEKLKLLMLNQLLQKTATKLSKSIKQPEIITQQPKFNKQFKLTRPCTKNNLSEITKKIKDYKFDKLYKDITFVEPELDSYKEVFDDIFIDELLDKQLNELAARTGHITDWFECYFNITTST